MDLQTACEVGNVKRVRQLIEDGHDVNAISALGITPIMTASARGHAIVVLELIIAGADVSAVSSHEWSSVAAGSTALHFAAEYNRTECGVLLVEAGADIRTRNKDSKSPMDYASVNFQQTIQRALSFTAKRSVAVIGNSERGKSTLIAALQAEGKSLFKKFTNRFTKVQDFRQRTAGIEVVRFSSQKYGETLFYDFAGQSDYHGPHQSFLEAMLSKPGVSVSLLLLVKATDEEDVVMQQVTRWLQPLSLTSAPSIPQVIIVGSFLDQVMSREEATEKLLRCTQSVQEEFDFAIQGPCLLDCRKPESQGIDRISIFLQENEPLQLNCKTFSYNLRWVLMQLQKEFFIPAITLNTFQSWLVNDAKLNSKHFPSAETMCRDLTAVGHALFLPNKRDPSQSWLILDLQAILHDVYGILFSGSQGKVNQFGLLHCSRLAELFPELDPAMIQEVLICLEFCIEVDFSPLREELLKLTAQDEGDGWLYFPALVSAQPPELFPEDADPHHFQWVCWQLRTAKKNLISAHLLQTIILCLAANHVFTHELSPSVREHCCNVWVNGLSWRSTKGVDVVVQISDSSVVQVVGHSKTGSEKLHQYMSTIVSDVIKTTAQLSPKLQATSYIVHPYTPAMWNGAKALPPDSLYPVSSIIHCISDGDYHVLSLPRQDGHLPRQTSLTELFGGWSPSLSVVQDMDLGRESQRGPGQVATLGGVSPPTSTGGAAQTKSQAGVTGPTSSSGRGRRSVLSRTVHSVGHKQCAVLFRKYVSRNVQGKGRAVLEGVGLSAEAIEMCYMNSPRNEEEAVQSGLHMWREGKGASPTWAVLLEAMDYAEIGIQHMTALEEAVLKAEVPPESELFPLREEPSLLTVKRDTVSPTALAETHTSAQHTVTEAVVTFDYDAQRDDELTLRVGQVLKNVHVVWEGWAEGELLGKVGMFPANFVKMRSASPDDRLPPLIPKEDRPPPSMAMEGQDLQEFAKRYSEVVRNQAIITLKITKCTTIGPPRIGKTCFKHLLTGNPWDIEAGMASTDVMEAPEWVECYSLEGSAEELWKLISKEEQQGELFRAVNTSTNSSDAPPTTNPSDETDAPSTAILKDGTDVPPNGTDAPPNRTDASSTAIPSHGTDAPTTAIPRDVSDAPPTTNFSDAAHTITPSGAPSITTPSDASPPTNTSGTVMQAIKALACSPEELQDILADNKGKVLGETHLIYFIDTGGQAIYHDVHPVLITSPSIYFVVFSLKDFYKKSREEQLSYFQLDFIQRPLRSIYTFGAERPQEEHLQFHTVVPTIFIVGTHLDHIQDKREEFLMKLHEMISTEIGNKPYREFVQYDPKSRSFWAVDNTRAGREQDEEFTKYISKLRSMVIKRSMEMTVKVPLPWLLLKTVMDTKRVRYCKYSELLDEACIRGYVSEHSPEGDLDTMLRLFHILGLLYHMQPRGCNKKVSLVFIDPDCLYSATSDFLMAAKEEIEDSSEDTSQIQAATMKEIEDSQEGRVVGQYQTQTAVWKKRNLSKELNKVEIKQRKLDPEGIVEKNKVVQRMDGNVKCIEKEMKNVLQFVAYYVGKFGQQPVEEVLSSLHSELKEIGNTYMLHPENQNGASVKAKRQLFIGRLVHTLASSVKALLEDSERKGDVLYVREELEKAVKNVTACYENRSVGSHNMGQFLSILSELRIVAQLSDSDFYVVPAALPKLGHANPILESPFYFRLDPILVTMVSQTVMEVCYLPSGLFCCLISELVTELGWNVFPVGRTHVAFMHDSFVGTVHVIEHESYIEIKLQLEASQQELAQTCQTVRRSVHRSIVRVHVKLYNRPTEGATVNALVWGFQCDTHPSDESHIAELHEDDDYGCYAECLLQGCSAMQPVTPGQMVWVQGQDDHSL